jgi:hypothetical protein
MPLPRRRVAALAAAVTLVAPATAYAQSAGDEQYQDPFAGEDQGQSQDGSNDQGQSQGGSDDGSGPAAEPAPAAPGPATAAPAAEAAPGGDTSAAPAATAAGSQLAYTGADAGAVLLAGSLLLASGVALRVRLRERS